MTFQIQVPIESENITFAIQPGESLIFVGANGGGKTRLAVHIEKSMGQNAHRISAHRSLALNPDVAKISERQARHALRFGNPDPKYGHGHRDQMRWGQKAATFLLNDFDKLVQVLFAEKTNTTDRTHRAARAGTLDLNAVPMSKFELLESIWRELLPHRELHVAGDTIDVSLPGNVIKYSGSEMSDGERAIFYMIGQVLIAEANTLLIIDEPELHVHRSIMAILWDKLEAARPDCAFVFITHDLEFAADRKAQKVVIKSFDPQPKWQLALVPSDTGFSEEIATLILGSRRPILFVEGGDSSLDVAVYRGCYPSWTVVSKNSCTEVIHSVRTMRNNAELTRVTCSGLIDSDGRDKEERAHLKELGIATLPVSEIENIFLLPDVSEAIAEHEGLTDPELDTRLKELATDIFGYVDTPEKIEAIVVRHCKRRVDRIMKRLDLGETANAADLNKAYQTATANVDVTAIAAEFRDRIINAVANRNLSDLLALVDNKGMLAGAARLLRANKKDDFESWLTRVMGNSSIAPGVAAAIAKVVPEIVPE